VLSKISLACVGALTALPHLAFAAEGAGPWPADTAAPDETIVALADSLPTANIESICRDAQSAALPESKAAAYKACVQDERAAYNELRQKWARYSAAARVSCAEPGDGSAISYVELQTCLDMQPGGSLTGPGEVSGNGPSLDTLTSPPPAARIHSQAQ
jgi:hypothetical protein